MTVTINQPVENFQLPSTEGDDFKLDAFRGQKIVLYFYPKDNTPGCTTEALEFTDLIDEYKAVNAQVFGISKDDIACHNRFIDKKNLGVPLLSDESLEIHKLFDVWQLKKNYGKEYMGTVRSTFIIDEQGILVKEFRNVKAKGHAARILNELQSLE